MNDTSTSHEARWVWRIAVGVLAAIGGAWAALVSLSWGALLVGLCAAIAVTDLLLSPSRVYPSGHRPGSGFKAFWAGTDTVAVGDRRRTGFGLFLVGICIGGGIGAFIRLEFPREVMPKEVLMQYVVECRQLRPTPVTSDAELKEYRDSASELIVAVRHWIRANLPVAALELYNSTAGVMPFAEKSDFNEEHRSWRNTLTRFCENIEQVIDNYAE